MPSAAEIMNGLPMYFEANIGQVASPVAFMARGGGYTLFLTEAEAVFSLTQQVEVEGEVTTRHENLRMILPGANATPQITGIEPLASYSSYFLGNDPTQWRPQVAHYGKVKYQNIYPGIDMVYYGNQSQLQYDFIVAPGSDPAQIQVQFPEAERLEVDADGDLLIYVDGGIVRQEAPFSYQEMDGQQIRVASAFRFIDAQTIGFTLGAYNPDLRLIIDPVLVYGTYLGGTDNETVEDIAVDNAGNVYFTGSVLSPDFPVQGAYMGQQNNSWDMYVTRVNTYASGATALVYSTYFGGSSYDFGKNIEIDGSSIYVAGGTDSSDFPTTAAAYQPAFQGNRDATLIKLNSAGNSLLYSTYLGGTDYDLANAIVYDTGGIVYLAGVTDSINFPTTASAYQLNLASRDVFISKIDTTLAGSASLLYSTYFGGSQGDEAWTMKKGGGGIVYIGGHTNSFDFPLTASAYQSILTAPFNSPDAFITEIDTNQTGASALIYSSYIGGAEGETVSDLAVDSSGNVYIVGGTGSSDYDTQNALYPNFLGQVSDGFISKFDPNSSGNASLLYSTFIGGSGIDVSLGVDIDSADNVIINGHTNSLDFPLINAYQNTFMGNTDAYVMQINSQGTAISFSTYIGGSGYEEGHGIALDAQDRIYIIGASDSPNFPTTASAYQSTMQGVRDLYLAVLGLVPSSAVVDLPATASTVTEADAPVSIQLALTVAGGSIGFPSPVNVTIQTGGSATEGVDYTLDTTSVDFTQAGDFPNGVYTATVTVTLLDDGEVEGDEELVLTLQNPTNGAALGTNTTYTLTITDNDTVATPEPTSVVTSEPPTPQPPSGCSEAELEALINQIPNDGLRNAYHQHFDNRGWQTIALQSAGVSPSQINDDLANAIITAANCLKAIDDAQRLGLQADEFILVTASNIPRDAQGRILSSAGDVIEFIIPFQNPKNKPLTQVVITANFDRRLEDLQLVSHSVGRAVIAPNMIALTDFVMQPRQIETLVVRVRVAASVQPGDVLTVLVSLESPDASIHVDQLEILIIPETLPATGQTPIWRRNLTLLLLLGVLGLAGFSVKQRQKSA